MDAGSIPAISTIFKMHPAALGEGAFCIFKEYVGIEQPEARVPKHDEGLSPDQECLVKLSPKDENYT